ncbi:large conductance mechanosensitive channel protein MscL [Prosthecobacter vanneervenii]|uniref:Large-conductance mechanosensitive channel n=1 Tax=Prosthecobacter vanneervenii TaxID=48466 RepID=A0A7W7YA12_9BACT|nr:large conductance mechanosensitive channel protein MscL [Prosthecobacter vanneervenii]MBB5032259.1 large conductance mechanosensitive channel [Prosthecobacter vanneervenii]
MLKEFKAFILKGNVVDLSTGVIIGAAFSSIVSAFTKGIIEPLLKAVGGNPNVSLGIKIGEFTNEKGEKLANMLDIGMVINAVIGFLITAAVIFFVIVKPVNALLARLKTEEAVAPPPAPAEDVLLLREIRDLLKK